MAAHSFRGAYNTIVSGKVSKKTAFFLTFFSFFPYFLILDPVVCLDHCMVVQIDDDDEEVTGGIYDEEDTANLILSNAFCISLSNDSVKSLDLKTESD